MRLPRITLAAKYRLLFGAAVLLIIGAALAVPWMRMDQLVLDLPYREARRIAADYFRFELPHKEGAPAGVHGGDYSLLQEPPPKYPPRFLPYSTSAEDPNAIATTMQSDKFVAHAFRAFIRNPATDSTFQLEYQDGTRWLRYAHAVRVAKRCLSCHDEGKSAVAFNENQLAGIVTVQLPADASNQTALNRIVLVTAGLLAGILAILVFYLLVQKFILAPVQELREVTIRVAEGEQEVRADIRTGDEFEQLAANFNIMLERLRASQTELQKANRLLDQQLGEMAQSNVALFESNRVKSEFLANISHELRTPLTSIIGFAELMREGPGADPAKAKRYSENILISGRILLEIINDLLDLAKIEAGKVELHVEAVNLPELCATMVDIMRPLADKKDLILTLECDPALPVIESDAGRLRQILYNLLSNAIKFTPAGGRVALDARRASPERIELSVTDSGPGISAEHQRLIFQKFRQIDQSATREHHGTGLGLAISKELTGLLGGEIGVASTPGRGARFWVQLPLSVPQAVVERPAVSLV